MAGLLYFDTREFHALQTYRHIYQTSARGLAWKIGVEFLCDVSLRKYEFAGGQYVQCINCCFVGQNMADRILVPVTSTTVNGRNPASPNMYETLLIMG